MSWQQIKERGCALSWRSLADVFKRGPRESVAVTTIAEMTKFDEVDGLAVGGAHPEEAIALWKLWAGVLLRSRAPLTKRERVLLKNKGVAEPLRCQNEFSGYVMCWVLPLWRTLVSQHRFRVMTGGRRCTCATTKMNGAPRANCRVLCSEVLWVNMYWEKLERTTHSNDDVTQLQLHKGLNQISAGACFVLLQF